MGHRRSLAALFVLSIPCGALALAFGGCSSNRATSSSEDGGPLRAEDSAADAPAAADAGDSAIGPGDVDGGARDGSVDAPVPTVTGMAIASPDGGLLQGAPGDAIQLTVVLSMSDGTTRAAAASEVSWVAPVTLVAQDPNDAGVDIVPEAGAQPTAFFVQNPYATTNAGVLYVLDPGTGSDPTVTVTASVLDAGQVSTSVAILPPLVGDASNGANLFLHGPECAICHGLSGGGSPPLLLPDGGPELLDGGPLYAISGQIYPYPAPGLNDAPDSGNLASDPAWNAALLGIAAQSDMDNQGVALRAPMPDWFGGSNATGGTLRGQDFADIYAWLKTQTK